MVETLYPPRFSQRVLALEAPGAEPATVSLVVPTITAVGEPFTVKVAVLDELGYVSTQLDGRVRVRAPFARPGALEVPFRSGLPATAQVRGVVIEAEGLYRFQAELDGRVFAGNPTRCLGQPTQRVYWGDPHVHTVLSNCHPEGCRSLNFCYVAARYLSGLDWVAAADHVSNGRCDFAKWKAQCAACNAYDDPPEFATLPGYEASLKGGAGGDNNVYMLRQPEMFVDEYEDGTVKTICRKLAEKLPAEEFFVVPHHTTRTNKHGEIGRDIYPGPELMPVVEIHSKWGTSEYRGNPNALHKIHPGPSYAVDLLNRGLKLGFIAGTDSHATMPSATGEEPGHVDRLPGLTAVFADRLSREAIYHGIRGRSCYAASLERVWLDVEIAGAEQGQTIAWPDPSRPREITVAAAGRSDLVSIDVVRNGQTIDSQPVGSWRGSVEFTDDSNLSECRLEADLLGEFAYYYVRVTCASGAQAWSSPVWLLLRR